MAMVSVPEVILVGSALSLGLYAIQSHRADVTYIRASDGREYLVQNFPDRAEAAETLAWLRTRLITFLDYAASHKEFAGDPRIVRLRDNWNRDTLSEGSNRSKYTSFTTDKHDITMCLRNATTNAIEPKNVLMFVLLHEAAHCATVVAIDAHNSDFWNNFKFILQVAVDANLYEKQDFRAHPIKFCGVDVTDSPLH